MIRFFDFYLIIGPSLIEHDLDIRVAVLSICSVISCTMNWDSVTVKIMRNETQLEADGTKWARRYKWSVPKGIPPTICIMLLFSYHMTYFHTASVDIIYCESPWPTLIWILPWSDLFFFDELFCTILPNVYMN